MQGGDDPGDDGGDAQALGRPLVGADVDQRAQAELVGGDRHRGPYPAERGAGGPGQRLEHREQRRRQHALGGDVGAEGGELGGVGQVAAATRCQASSKRVAGELGGVVAAVVEEAGVAVDVADGGVGDGDAVEAGGDIDQGGHVRPSSPVRGR